MDRALQELPYMKTILLAVVTTFSFVSIAHADWRDRRADRAEHHAEKAQRKADKAARKADRRERKAERHWE